MGPCKSVLISEVSLIRRFPYNSCNIMLYNLGPQTLVRIVEVSIIGGVCFGGSTVVLCIEIEAAELLHYSTNVKTRCFSLGVLSAT